MMVLDIENISARNLGEVNMLQGKMKLIGCAYVLLVAGVCLGAAARVELQNADGESSGHAVLSYSADDDKTIIQVNCSNLEADTEYKVYLADSEVGTFSTMQNGRGHLHSELDGDRSSDRPVTVRTMDDTIVLTGE
jgi:hypothetical protein